jgi:ribonuclease HI
VFQILFEVSNNEAEYEALLHGLCLAVSLGIKRLLVYSDFLLVVQQVNKEWDVNKDTMDAYVAEIRKLENKFSGLEIHHVIRDNMRADVLSHRKFSYMSCINLPSRYQIQVPSLRVQRNPTKRS